MTSNMLLKTIFAISLFHLTYSFMPSCEKFNQFRYYCFEIEHCSNYSIAFERCEPDLCGYFDPEVTTIVKIKQTEVIPRCAFVSCRHLQYIIGINSGIHALAIGSFRNLPAVKNIHLAYNHIKVIQHGIFHNVSAEVLDLSWNKIRYFQEGAFNYANFTYLNLTRNFLTTIPASLGFSIQHLNLSYNLFNRIVFNSKRYRNLTDLDLSYNKLENVAFSFDYPINLLDLTHNELFRFDFAEFHTIKEMRISLNNFMQRLSYLEDFNAEVIELYPNPWRCSELQSMWRSLLRLGIKLKSTASTTANQNTPPVCLVSKNNSALHASARHFYEAKNGFIQLKSLHSDCKMDGDCPHYLTCRRNKCLNPCEDENLCHRSKLCFVKNHNMVCQCPEGTLLDPIAIYTTCENLECIRGPQCGEQMVCKNNKCITEAEACGPGNNCGFAQYYPSGQGGYGADSPYWWYEEIPKELPSYAQSNHS